MYDTYKMMCPLVPGKVEDYKLEDVAKLYQESKDSKYIAITFVKVFPFLVSETSKYYNLPKDDLASETLTTIDRCLLKFDPEKGGFFTLFTTAFRNSIYKMIGNTQTDKNIANSNTASLDAILDSGAESFIGKQLVIDEYDLSEHPFADVDLTAKQKEFCSLLMLGYTIIEAGKMMGVSGPRAYHLRDAIKAKVLLRLGTNLN